MSYQEYIQELKKKKNSGIFNIMNCYNIHLAYPIPLQDNEKYYDNYKDKKMVIDGPISLAYFPNINHKNWDKPIKLLIFGEQHDNINRCKDMKREGNCDNTNYFCINVINMIQKIFDQKNICIDSYFEHDYKPNKKFFKKMGKSDMIGGVEILDDMQHKFYKNEYYKEKEKINKKSNRIHNIDIRKMAKHLSYKQTGTYFFLSKIGHVRKSNIYKIIRVVYSEEEDDKKNTFKFLRLMYNYLYEFEEIKDGDLGLIKKFYNEFIKEITYTKLFGNFFDLFLRLKDKIQKQFNNLYLITKNDIKKWYLYSIIKENLDPVHMNGLMVDIYTISRIFRKYDEKIDKPNLGKCNIKDNPDSKIARNIVIYAGDFHSSNYIHFINYTFKISPIIIVRPESDTTADFDKNQSCIEVPMFKPFGIDLTK